MAEGEVRAADEVARADPGMQHLGDERVGGHPRERAVEGQLVEDPHAERRQRRRPRGAERQAERRVVGAEQLARMRLERQHRERGVGARGVGGAQQVGVAEMHAVEIAERHGRPTRGPRQIVPVAKNLHPQPRTGGITTASPSITVRPATVQIVRSVARFRSMSSPVTSTVAVTVSPIATGARNFSVWLR